MAPANGVCSSAHSGQPPRTRHVHAHAVTAKRKLSLLISHSTELTATTRADSTEHELMKRLQLTWPRLRLERGLGYSCIRNATSMHKTSKLRPCNMRVPHNAHSHVFLKIPEPAPLSLTCQLQGATGKFLPGTSTDNSVRVPCLRSAQQHTERSVNLRTQTRPNRMCVRARVSVRMSAKLLLSQNIAGNLHQLTG